MNSTFIDLDSNGRLDLVLGCFSEHYEQDSATPLPLAVAAPTTAVGLALYPNPAITAATVVRLTANATVQVVNTLGRPVATTVADASGKAQLLLPAGLAAGICLVCSNVGATRLAVQ